MVLVTVHTYNCGYSRDGDAVQLLGIYSDNAHAKAAVDDLMKHYIEQYLNKRNVFPGHIESLQNLKAMFPNTYEQVEKILCPEYFPADINRTFSIEVNDIMHDFKEPIYDTAFLPAVSLAEYFE